MTRVAQWVQDIVARHSGGHVPLQIGSRYNHENRVIKVTGGHYWGEYGLSNFWYWRPVLADGSLGPEEHGYDNQGAFTPI